MIFWLNSSKLSRLLSALLVLTALSCSANQAATKSKHAKNSGTEAKTTAASSKNTSGKTETKTEPVLENVSAVSPDDLVGKPQEYLGKNVKFTASFFAWSNLGLDYKPAFRSSKTHLSFLILKPGSHIPLSELKLAMLIPKEKDPEAAIFATLKDGDQIELTGKVFSAALDDPWMEVLKLKRLSSAPDDKDKDKKTVSSNDNSAKNSDSVKETQADKSEKKSDKSSSSENKDNSDKSDNSDKNEKK